MKGIKEHYVPQFYLKNFGDQIYLYDKKTRKVGQSTPQNVAFERNFYVDSGNDDASKLEGWMSQFEGRASALLSTIIEAESIAGVSDADMATLCDFVAFQFARTPGYRERRSDMTQSMLDALAKGMGITDWRYTKKEEYAGRTHLASMIDYVRLARPYLLRMGAFLFRNDTGMPLWTSDNPVARDNNLTGKLGLGSPGVEFYLPLTPKLLLMFYDSTHINLLDGGATASISGERRARERSSIPETADMVKENIVRANHLQTVSSTRFVFSNEPHFYMIEKFLEADAGYKKRHVCHDPGRSDEAGNAGNNLGVSGTDALNHNLQNAILWYQSAKQETDTCRAFMCLCTSLEMVTGPGWNWDVNGREFDDHVRRLTGDPALSLDGFRQIYDRIRRCKHPDPNADAARMAKDVEELRLIADKAIKGRIREMRSGG